MHLEECDCIIFIIIFQYVAILFISRSSDNSSKYGISKATNSLIVVRTIPKALLPFHGICINHPSLHS
ncbi:hypothetical protein Glove_117g578 [Diversispora epigaea]|uniref:Uncharacterized protein n=1 Tax=Diversispora epigaea TaxID=1348612 RepID=A0A397J9L7_9GLOM|nr:hypothetical protein Glove_117g578 [Diversispora epigaea]